ncbi:hypothetical protein DCF50_p1439 [Dehalobacter sp. CF]|nr:hypothetical protein DCF50_p1439 [Dehalobacter sp. CF]
MPRRSKKTQEAITARKIIPRAKIEYRKNFNNSGIYITSDYYYKQ